MANGWVNTQFPLSVNQELEAVEDPPTISPEILISRGLFFPRRHNGTRHKFIRVSVCFFFSSVLQLKEKYLLPLSLRRDTNLVETKNHLLCEDVLQSNSVPTLYVPAGIRFLCQIHPYSSETPSSTISLSFFLSLILTHA